MTKLSPSQIKKVKQIAIFNDFNFFLEQAKQEKLFLTNTGNLNLKTIELLGENFTTDIYDRDKEGNIRRKIRSEDEVSYLWKIKGAALAMKLVSKSKKKLNLSRDGGLWLMLDLDSQYYNFVNGYQFVFNWEYAFPYLENRSVIAKTLQDNLALIWSWLYQRQLERDQIDVDSLNQWLVDKFSLTWPNYRGENIPDLVESSIRSILIKQLVDLGLFEPVKTVKDKYGGEVNKVIKITSLGIWFLENAFVLAPNENYWEEKLAQSKVIKE